MTDRTAPPPLPRRVLQTFTAPRDLFGSFGEDAPWVGPLMISVAVAMLAVALIPDAAFVEAVQGATTRRGEPVTITSSPEAIARTGRMYGMLVTLVRQPLGALTAAGVLTLVFSVLLGGEGRFRQYLAITTHALLVTALGTLVALAVAAARGAELAPVSPALLPFLRGDGFVHRALAGIDLFTLWALVVAGLGASMVNRRLSWARAAAVLVGIYLALVLALAALGA